MSCQPAFVPGVSIECITAIVSDVRSGKPTKDTLAKLAWVIGCGLATMQTPTDPNTIHVFGTMESDAPATVDECCDRIAACCFVGAGESVVGWTPNPENLKALLAFLMQLAQMILPLITHQ